MSCGEKCSVIWWLGTGSKQSTISMKFELPKKKQWNGPLGPTWPFFFEHIIQILQKNCIACTSIITFRSGGWFNKKVSSYQYRKSHCGDETILRLSYLHNGISYTGKTTSLYWIKAQVTILRLLRHLSCHDMCKSNLWPEWFIRIIIKARKKIFFTRFLW